MHTFQRSVESAIVVYRPTESRGPLALVITAAISLCAVIAVLIVLILSGFNTRFRFIRTQVGACFLSLMISDLFQATGSVMNARWIVMHGVSSGSFCTAQAALKQSGNVGTAMWSLVIAIHTFFLLFLHFRIRDHIFFAILVVVWLFIAFIVMLGPLVIQNSERGPFWGVSGYWCWITAKYSVEQLTNEYLFMFLTAGTSFILYSLIYFRLRGNIQGFGWKLRFRTVDRPWTKDEGEESPMLTAGKQMLWYPVAYIIIIFPIAICRWSTIFNHKVPQWAIFVADSVFMLSGLVNAILYTTTRKIVSIRSVFPFSKFIHSQCPGDNCSQDCGVAGPNLDGMEFATPASIFMSEKSTTHPSFKSSFSAREEQWRSYSDPEMNRNHEHKPSRDFQGFPIQKSRKILKDGQASCPRLKLVAACPQLNSLVGEKSRRSEHESWPPQGLHSPHNAEQPGSDIAHDVPTRRYKHNIHDASSQSSAEMIESMQVDLDEMEFAPPTPPFNRKILH